MNKEERDKETNDTILKDYLDWIIKSILAESTLVNSATKRSAERANQNVAVAVKSKL